MSKKMKNAPVYFVIAQVRHNPVLKLDFYAPDIQDLMRKSGYPDFRPGVGFAFSVPIPTEMGNPSQQVFPGMERISRFMFFSVDGARAFIVDQNAITFHTTEYGTFDEFADEFIKGVRIVHECVNNLELCERVGLRYLDAIVPPAGEVGLREYLVPEVLGINNNLPSDIRVARAFSETLFQTSNCSVTARTVIQSGPLGFPQDLQQIGVNIADRFQKINGVHAIIDTDASIEGRRPFNLDSLKGDLQVLQQGARLAFDATVTQAALDAWKS